MRGKGSGFGFIMLVIVMAVVLFLVARSWSRMAPAAMQVDDHGQTEAAEALESGDLPDLNDMKKQTDARSEEMQAILEQE
jgi:hypothetical protein